MLKVPFIAICFTDSNNKVINITIVISINSIY